METRLLLLEKNLANVGRIVATWHDCMKTDFTLVNCFQTGLLAVLRKEDIEKLAELIEKETFPSYDCIPLFILWEDSRIVHEYAPFENGVRQLVKQHMSNWCVTR